VCKFTVCTRRASSGREDTFQWIACPGDSAYDAPSFPGVRPKVPAWLSRLLLRLRALFGADSARSGGDEVDAELRDAFLAELEEMIASATASLSALRDNPADAARARTLARCFHTLKGSAPLVGAPALAALGRAGEQTMQRASERRMVNARQFQSVESAVALLPAWKDALRHGRPAPSGTSQVIAQLERSAG